MDGSDYHYRMRRYLFLLLSSLLLCGTVFALASGSPESLPFTTNSDGLVILPAHFGLISGHVFFDTGAGLDVLAPSIVHELRGKPSGHFTGFRMGGERLDLDLYTIPELRVGPLQKKNTLVAAWDALDSPEFKKLDVRGIISLNDFRKQPVTFVFQRKLVIFETTGSLRNRARESIVPLEFDDQRGISLDSFAQFSIDAQPGECEIDMGTPSAWISTRYFQSLGLDADTAGVKKHVSKNIAGATVVRYDTTIRQLSLAGAPDLRLEHPQVSFMNLIYDCVIGVDFWQGKSVTFDVPDRKLMVSTRD